MQTAQVNYDARRARADDIGALTELVEKYWRFEGIAGFDAARIGAQLRRLVSDERLGACWIAEKGGAPVGYLLAVYVFSLEHFGMTAEIDEFFIRPDARGKGLGSRLLKTAEETFTTERLLKCLPATGPDQRFGSPVLSPPRLHIPFRLRTFRKRFGTR